MRYWLVKADPSDISVDDLRKRPNGTIAWYGIRNYQSRNFMRDQMVKGDLAFFYHSNCAEPAVVGMMAIVGKAYPDHTQFDSQEKYFDPDSPSDNPRWLMVDVRFRRKWSNIVTLRAMKSEKRLSDMRLVQRGNRLSILPVSAREWRHILKMAGEV
jgi:predicted RNA-binding protein with PUA-like domain